MTIAAGRESVDPDNGDAATSSLPEGRWGRSRPFQEGVQSHGPYQEITIK